MTINSEFFPNSNTAVAMELFAAGWCNLSCKYCYIPKTDFLKTIHSKIIKRIEDGSMLKDLEEMFGESLESLSHWGTEPTLTTGLFKEFYEQAIVKFPKLNRVMLSSNFMTPSKNIIKFVNEILPKTKKLEVAIQMSLDGPAWITDENRSGGSAVVIMRNIKEFLAGVDITAHNITLNFKPTINKKILTKLCNIEELKEYYLFYDNFFSEMNQVLDLTKIRIANSVNPTVAVPDTYSKEDGINFYKLTMNQLELACKEKYNFITPPSSFYYSRYREKVNYFREYHTKQKMFTCSAGDSCFAGGDLDDTIYSCHRSFYIPYKEYENSCKEWPLDEENTNGIKQGRVETMKNLTISNFKNKKEMARTLYVSRCYHDFTKHRLTTQVATIRELAYINQMSPIYKNLGLAVEFSKFLQAGYCHMDNITSSNCYEISNLGNFRLFGNGTFEQYCKMLIEEEKRGIL